MGALAASQLLFIGFIFSIPVIIIGIIAFTFYKTKKLNAQKREAL